MARAAAAWLAIGLAACGGGSGSSPTEPPPGPATIGLAGLVADRAAWAGAELAFSCVDGQARRVQAASDGRYALELSSAALPCLVQATSSGGERLWSAATASGTVNVTPGSDWTVARALRTSTAGLVSDLTLVRRLSVAAVAQAQTDLRRALADSGLAAADDLIAAPLTGIADTLLASQQQVLAALAAREVGPLLLRQALALQPDMLALRDALAQGRLSAAMALPTQVSDDASPPQLVSGLVSLLTGPSDLVFGVNAEGSWRTTDGGEHWTPVNHVLSQVLRFKGRLWARDLDGPVVSDDGGLHWTVPASAPSACRPDKDQMWVSPVGRLWFFPDSGCPGVRDHYTDDGLTWQSQPWDSGNFRLASLQLLANRQAPLRQIFFREGTRERVTSCLAGECVDSAVLDWPYVQALWPVEGSGEVIAGLTDARTGLPASMALSADGITWQAMSYLPFNSMVRLPQGGLLASPGANAVAVPSTNPRVRRSDDNGKTWRPSDPAVAATEGWLPLGTDTRLRKAGSQVELSTDAGRNWAAVPDIAAQRDRRTWSRGPDGTLLRFSGVSLQASVDDGSSWREVVATDGGVVGVSGPAWLDDRWVMLGSARVFTSANGLQWASAPLASDNVIALAFRGALASDDGVWVFSTTYTTSPHVPSQTVVLESQDQGKTWVTSQRSDALASSCGGLRYLWRPRAADGVPDWQMRTDLDPAWRDLPLPAGIERSRGVDLYCDRGLLMVRVRGLSSETRTPYYNEPSGGRGRSHWLSPDHGAHWFAVGRPGTDLFHVEGRWWSVGLDSVLLWP